ncbi:hypothetical protein ABBQ38_000961 [Trebouxia sp. C0009 RCD-2024]
MYTRHSEVPGFTNPPLLRQACPPRRSVYVNAWKPPFGIGQKKQKKQVREPSGEIQKELLDFQGWTLEQGLPKQQVEVRNVPGQGRGLFATEGIRKGQQLLQIPETLLLTAEKAARECCFGSVLTDAGLPDWTVLASYLVELWDQHKEGEASSYWAPYIALLPEDTGCILEWTDKEVQGLLQGSPLQQKANEIRQAAAASWREVQPALQQAADKGLIKPEAFTQGRYQWAFSILLTRLCRLEGRRGEEALVAWGDMANHRSDVDTFLDWSASRKCVTFQPDRSYAPGEQMYVSYGQKTSGELLLSYGFMLAPESNPHDAYLLQLQLDVNDSQRKHKLAALAKFRLKETQQFPLRANALPAGLLEFAAFIAAAPGKSDEVPVLAEYLFGKQQFPLLDKVDCRVLGINFVLTACRTAMLGYRKTMEADKEYIETQRTRLQDSSFGAEDDTGSQVAQIERSIAAAMLRVRERQILLRTSFVLQQTKR